MTDYQIQPNSRRCAATGRELCPGEAFFTALLETAGQFMRQDYSVEAWQGPPPGAFSFWSGKVPSANEPQKPRIDDDLLLECFERLHNQDAPGRVSFRYVVGLLLMRRKRLKFEQSTVQGSGESQREVLTLRCVATGTTYEVVNPAMSEEEMTTVQEEVFKVLGWQ